MKFLFIYLLAGLPAAALPHTAPGAGSNHARSGIHPYKVKTAGIGKATVHCLVADTGTIPVAKSPALANTPVSAVSIQSSGTPNSSAAAPSVDLFFKTADFSGDGTNASPFELNPTGVTAGVYNIGSASITVDSKGRIKAISINGNAVPAAPAVTADDNANTLSVSHALGSSEVLVSVNDAAFIQYDGAVINVGNVARAAGYWKFKVKPAAGRAESSVVNSPAFTAVAAVSSNTAKDIAVTATISGTSTVTGSNFTESPLHTYFSTTPKNVLLTSKVLPANTDGIIYASYSSSACTNIFLALDEVKFNANIRYSVYANSYTNTYYYTEGTVNADTGIPVVTGTSIRLGIKRKGTTLTEVLSTDGGTTWKDIHTFNGTTSAALYVKFFNFQAGNLIVNPKIQLL